MVLLNDCQYVPYLSQPKQRTTPGWEYYATMPARYPWICITCEGEEVHWVSMSHEDAEKAGLVRIMRF